MVLCLCLAMSISVAFAEEDGEYQETEEPIPDSYYAEIESNGMKDWPQGPAIESASAVVMDIDTGAFLYSKQATEKMYPASITKIMTTLLLIENCDLDDTITFSGIVYDLEEGSSHLGIQPGEEMTLRDAAYGIMLASANDISNGVAEYIGGSLSGFADMMNARAEELGCLNTHFSNPHGLYSEDHYTCAHDMALIAQAAYSNPVFREIVGTREYTIPETNLVEEERSFANHHKMMQSYEEYYRDWCTGGKTGFTSQCLNTLVTFGEKDGMRLVSVVLRVNGAGKAYTESTQILEYAFENFRTENFEKTSLDKDFYDIMRLKYLGDCAEFQSPVWKRKAVEECSVCLTLPRTALDENLTYTLIQEDGNRKKISYQYSGQTVGWATGSFSSIYAPARLVFEKEAGSVSADIPDTDIQIESIEDVFAQTVSVFDAGYRMLEGYTQDHLIVVIAGGAAFLILLIVLIVLMAFRAAAQSRIRKRRKQEELERKKREEEIERMTAAEIEAELRAGMEQERRRREQERKTGAEAERAAEERI